jgi:hypothetical protein
VIHVSFEIANVYCYVVSMVGDEQLPAFHP